MGDIALLPGNQDYDLGIHAQDIQQEDGLKSAIIVSLFSDRRAELSELITGETDRRGWWGDMVAEVDGDQIGSKLWLLTREKATDEVLVRAEEYIREALQWLIDDGVVDTIDLTVEFNDVNFLAIEINLSRTNAANVVYNFDYAWRSETGT